MVRAESEPVQITLHILGAYRARSRRLLVGRQLDRARVGIVALGDAKIDNGPLRVTEEDQRAIAARLSSALAGNTLLDEAATELGVDQAAIGLINRRDQRRIADPFRPANFANQRFGVFCTVCPRALSATHFRH